MDPNELERRLEELHPDAWGWALACAGPSRQEAEEVLQVTYLKVLEGRARFGGRSSFKTWLFGVLRRTAAERRRRAGARRLLLERFWPRESTAPTDPERSAGLSERAAAVRRALETLSRRQRQVVELVFYHELTVREAAEVLGVGVGSARVHYARGKRELARRLDPEVLA